ncbi:peptidoglycan editing factor PgeF [Hathewaya histolytica]|uniref:peptidoglycan editing factor PgeF n=1 Tax=Hathewaya histolytica TaxID=1498 RepID=UPI003B67FD6A
MKEIQIKQYKFIGTNYDNVNIIFSTAECGLDFNKNSDVGRKNLENLKEWFELSDVGYLNQVHGDRVIKYKGITEDGDAIITGESGVAIGVFTADCVPILLLDKKNKVLAAIHSGWRGTLKNISSKTIDRMVSEYSANPEDILAYIGPHNGACCFEVGEEVIEQFKSTKEFKESMIEGRNLNLAEYIENALVTSGLKKDNINLIPICTYCSKDVKLHSYRKGKDGYGRMFSFIYKK